VTVHGDRRVDPFFWLREKDNPEVLDYLKTENAYTDAMTAGLEPLRAKLYAELLGRIKQTDLSVPVRKGDYLYSSRTEEGKQYPIRLRRPADQPDAPEEVLLDLNELAKGKPYYSVGAFEVSDDGHLLAYTADESGYREYTLYVKDLRTGELLADRIEKIDAVEWATDNRSLLYATEDAAKRPYRIYRHTLAADPKDDPLVYEEKDELYRADVSRTRDKKFFLIGCASSDASDVRVIPCDDPAAEPRLVLPREADHEYDVEHRDGLFYIRTNKDAKNFRVVTAPVADPSAWTELVPHNPKVRIGSVDVFARYAVVSEREDALDQLRVINLASGDSSRIKWPEQVYSAFLGETPQFDTDVIRFSYTSFTTPRSVYDYNLKTGERTLLKATEVLGGYDPSLYESSRTFATAADGTKVPISLVRKKGAPRDGSAPLYLYGYGSYGASMPVSFDPDRLSLLDRGFIYAIAHIRGGGDLGEEWYDAGKMRQKMNTFTDFIACADHLVAEKYTSHDRIAMEGGSAGGLLMGAVLNLRPDLCRVALVQVPFVDVLNTMLDASLPLTIQEYLEWGNPNVKEEYDWIRAYCPYTNLAPRDYPAILVRVSLNDSQVPYWEGAKYVARLRALRGPEEQDALLLKSNLDAGHGGASGRYDALRDQAWDYAFVLSQLGINE
jgi:oligopeptidase B